MIMVRLVIFAIAAVPAIVALLIAVPMLTALEIPSSAANANDHIEIDYTRHHLKVATSESTSVQKSQTLHIANDGAATYTLIRDGIITPEKSQTIDRQTMAKLAAFIKETGIISIPAQSFPINDEIMQYWKSILVVTLNDDTARLSWPQSNATDSFIPPILTQLEVELDTIFEQFGE